MSTLSIISEFPVLRYTLDLAEYHPDLADNSIEVWLNLSDGFQEEWRAYNADLAAHIKAEKAKAAKAKKAPFIDMTDDLEQRRAELHAKLWNLDVADTVALFDKTEAAGLRAWMRRRTWEIIAEYATGRGEAQGVDPVAQGD